MTSSSEPQFDLLDSLRAANPIGVKGLPPEHLTRIRARVQLDEAGPATNPLKGEFAVVWRRRLAGIGGVVAVAAMLAAFSWAGLSSRVSPLGSSNGGVASSTSSIAAVAPGGSGTQGPAPSNFGGAGGASCVYLYSIETLRDREWAFDGVVTKIAGDQVTFQVNEWFRGSGTLAMTLTAVAGAGTSVIEGGTLGVGQRYLVAGEGRFVWGCGFTQLYDPAMAAQWRAAFAP
jgi:hypothetical protein